jgi:hypothetical protein
MHMTKMLITLAVCCSYLSMFGQTGTKVFSFPENNNQLVVTEISVAPDSVWYMAGSGVGDYQSFVTKLSPNNEVQWSKIYNDRRTINFIHALPNGHALIFNNNEALFEYFDISILEVDALGNPVSERVWGTESSIDRWGDYVLLPNGELIVLGTTTDDDGFESYNLMLRLSADGQEILEERAFVFEDGIILARIIPDADGGFYAVGGNFFDIFAIARFDVNADLLWAKTYEWPPSQIGLYAGVLLPDDNLFFAGSSGFGTEGSEVFCCKFDPDGTVLSNFFIKSEDGVSPDYIFPINGDTVVIAGSSNTQFWPIVDNDNLSIVTNVNTGEVYDSYAFGSNTRDYPFIVKQVGDQLVWAGLTNKHSTEEVTNAFYSFTPLMGTGDCAKAYQVSAGEITDIQPVITAISSLERIPPPMTPLNATATNTTLTVIGDCSTLNSTTDVRVNCVTAAATIERTLQAIQPIAQGEIQLTVHDLSGRQLIQTTTAIEQFNALNFIGHLPHGMYFYTFGFKGCGNWQAVTEKLVITY